MRMRRRRLGGHDPASLQPRTRRPSDHKGSPTVILARTIKATVSLSGAKQERPLKPSRRRLNEEQLASSPLALRGIPLNERGLQSLSYSRSYLTILPATQKTASKFSISRRAAQNPGRVLRQAQHPFETSVADQQSLKEFLEGANAGKFPTTMRSWACSKDLNDTEIAKLHRAQSVRT